MMFMTRLSAVCTFAVLLHGHVMAQGIYTCVDVKGRKITSDRPIAECMDRAQQEISPAGTVRRVLLPPPTKQERAALEEKEKKDAEDRIKVAAEKRLIRALLKRYPDRASHDRDRAALLELVNDAAKTATKRSEELAGQRQGISTELEFYKSLPGKAPAALKRRLDETDSNIATQKRLLVEQELEKNRITQRFDGEMAKLKALWDAAPSSSVATAPNDPPKP